MQSTGENCSTKSGWIYKITNKVNGNAYIGQSTAPDRRWMRHKCYCNNREKYKAQYDMTISKALRKWGFDSFDFEIIGHYDNVDAAEREWIEKLGTYIDGYNETIGGVGKPGIRWTEEMIADLGQIHDREVGEKWGISREAARSKRNQLGIEKKKQVMSTKIHWTPEMDDVVLSNPAPIACGILEVSQSTYYNRKKVLSGTKPESVR